MSSAPVFYQCQRCANCCRWPGIVRVDDAEIRALAEFVGLTEYDFIQRYTRLRPQRDGLSLVEKTNGECIFLDGRDCTVQPVKPRQCRGFPNEWNFPGWQEACEAIPVPAEPPAGSVRTNPRVGRERFF